MASNTVTLCSGNSRLKANQTAYPNFYCRYELYATDFNANRSKATLRLKLEAKWYNGSNAKSYVKVAQFTYDSAYEEGHDMLVEVRLPLKTGGSEIVARKVFATQNQIFYATADKDDIGATMAWDLTIDRVVAENVDLTKYYVGKYGMVDLWDAFSFCTPTSHNGADYGPYLYLVPAGTQFAMPSVVLKGSVHIWNTDTNSYDTYAIYIYNSEAKAWETYQPFIYNAGGGVTAWEVYG